MKKLVLCILLAVGGIALFAPKSEAFVVQGYDGYWYGNICRNGIYYQVVPYQLTNTACYMPMLNGWGVVSWE